MTWDEGWFRAISQRELLEGRGARVLIQEEVSAFPSFSIHWFTIIIPFFFIIIQTSF